MIFLNMLLLAFLPSILCQCDQGEVMINNQCVVNDISPLSTKVRVEASINVNFSWTFPNDSSDPYITMMLEYQTPYWFGFGLGTTMTDSDIWLFQVDQYNATIYQSDCFGKNYTGPSYDVQFGGQDNLILLGYQYNQDGVTTVKFKRLLDTGDIFDRVISQGPQPAIFAWGQTNDYQIAFHGNNVYIFAFKFEQGIDQTVNLNLLDSWLPFHMYINMICWGVLIDIPIILARYFKTKPWYLLTHGIIITLIIILSLIVECMGVYIEAESFNYVVFKQLETAQQLHMVFGTFILATITIQLTAGWGLWSKMMNKSKIFNQLQFFKLSHQLSGNLIYFVAKFEVAFGFYLLWPGFKSFQEYILYGVYILLIFWRLVLEYVFQLKKEWFYRILSLPRNQGNKVPLLKNQWSTNEENLLTFIEQQDYESIQNELGHKKWVIFNNLVIDLTKQIHPGGQFIWEQVQGREISRFIYGAYGLEGSTISPYNHSDYAIMMMQKLCIGTLRTVSLFNDQQQLSNLWTIASCQYITESISLFGLKKEGTTFLTQLRGIENFGRHFIVKSSTNKSIATRPYTMILCQASCNQALRKQQLSICSEELGLGLNKQEDIKTSPILAKQEFDEFPLLIKRFVFTKLLFFQKRYQSKTGFSQFIHSLRLGDSIEMSGPYGTSFGINSKEAAVVVLIACGTGLFPFLDLLDFLLKKTLYTLLKQKQGQEKADSIFQGDVQYDNYFIKGYKFILILSVQSQKDLIGSDIYLTLQNLQQYLDTPNFELLLSISDKSEVPGIRTLPRARFNEEFFRKYIPELMLISKFLICGPPSINSGVPQTLNNLGVPQQKIHLV